MWMLIVIPIVLAAVILAAWWLMRDTDPPAPPGRHRTPHEPIHDNDEPHRRTETTMTAVVADIEHARLTRAATRGDGEAVQLWLDGLRAKKRSAWLDGFDAALDQRDRELDRRERRLRTRARACCDYWQGHPDAARQSAEELVEELSRGT